MNDATQSILKQWKWDDMTVDEKLDLLRQLIMELLNK